MIDATVILGLRDAYGILEDDLDVLTRTAAQVVLARLSRR